MRKIREVVVVEGRYDKDTLSQVVDAVILETGGFGLFNDRQKQRLLRTAAEKRGLIVLTDSDGAGFVIRKFIRSCAPAAKVKHAYIPDRYGKERRKKNRSKEGKLGVEGMSPEILLDALVRAGASFEDKAGAENSDEPICMADLYAKGLSGGEGSREKRRALIRMLDLPEYLSTNALLDVLNALMSREEFMALSLPDPPHRAEE